ncbi:MAG: hypothetical protein M3Y46_00600, partial [Actinomycetota bacterium]|nr:hypothetical protein [Actinomycetota bacterium]
MERSEVQSGNTRSIGVTAGVMMAEGSERLADEAVELAQRWIAESAQAEVDPAAERLAGVLKDPNGLPFT